MSAELVRRAADALDRAEVAPTALAGPLATWLRIAAKEIDDVSEIAAPNGEPIEFEGPAIDVARAVLREGER